MIVRTEQDRETGDSIMTDKNSERPLSHFEIGRYYKHSGGETMYCCAYAGTYAYGVVMLAETGEGNFKPVGDGPSYCINWREISEDEFLNG